MISKSRIIHLFLSLLIVICFSAIKQVSSESNITSNSTLSPTEYCNSVCVHGQCVANFADSTKLICVCQAGYQGTTCNLTTSSSSSNWTINWWLVIIVIVGVIVIERFYSSCKRVYRKRYIDNNINEDDRTRAGFEQLNSDTSISRIDAIDNENQLQTIESSPNTNFNNNYNNHHDNDDEFPNSSQTFSNSTATEMHDIELETIKR